MKISNKLFDTTSKTELYKQIENLETQLVEVTTRRKGQVHILSSEGNIIPYEFLKSAETLHESKQNKEQDTAWLDTNGLIEKPFDPVNFLDLSDNNPSLARIIRQIATDSAGLGWQLNVKEDQEEDKSERIRIKALLNEPNDDETLRRILEAWVIDLQLIGYAGLEVGRNKDGIPSKIYHIRASELYRHKESWKFAQKRNNSPTWFRKYTKDNTSPLISKITGETSDDPEENDASEICFTKLYYPQSDYYGVPPLLPAIGQILSMIGIRDYNLSFFENFGVPAYIVLLEGEWDDAQKSTDIIHKFINTELRGSSNARKTLVLQPPDGCSAKFIPVDVQAREGSFRLYLDNLREDVMAVYSMPPYRLGIAVVGNLSGTTARELNEIYKNGVIEPIQDDIEQMVNAIINSDTYTFKLNDLDLNDEMMHLSMQTQEFNTGRKTVNDILKEKGKPPIDEEWANYHWINKGMIAMEVYAKQIEVQQQLMAMQLIQANRVANGAEVES